MEIYSNLELGSLENEIWRSIKGYEDSYAVSQLGRVKSLERIIEHPRLKKQLIHSRILKQNIKRSSSKHFDDYYIDCQVALTMDGKTRFKSVKRLVYSSFSSEIEFKKDKKVIVHLDFNGYNNHLDNLVSMTYQERYERIKERGRFFNSLIGADRTQWKNSKVKRSSWP